MANASFGADSPPRVAQGRTLGEFEPLLPAERMLLDRCVAGEIARIGDERPETCTETNRLRPAFVRFLALGGDAHAPLHENGVNIRGAWIDGDLNLTACQVSRLLFLWDCRLDGQLLIEDADLFHLNMGGTLLNGIRGDRMRCRSGVMLRYGFHATGPVRFPSAQIAGALSCTGGRFEGRGEAALVCDGISVDGGITLRKGFQAIGAVRLLGARLGAELDCSGGRFEATPTALDCDRMEAAGYVLFTEGFRAKGTVDLRWAKIGNVLDCTGAQFDGAGQEALVCRGIRIGSVFLKSGFRASGEVNFAAARVTGDFCCDGGQFRSESDYALRCSGMSVTGALQLRKLVPPDDKQVGAISLLDASASTLMDDCASWSRANFSSLVLDGFRYDRIAGMGTIADPAAADRLWLDARERIVDWLDLQLPRHLARDFRPQPWQQLAHVLTAMGHEDDAKTVRIAMHQRWRRSRWAWRETWWGKAYWYALTTPEALTGALVGYGYRPLRATVVLMFLWLAGGLIYSAVTPSGIMTPTDARIYLDRDLPAECRMDWIGFTGPRLPTEQQIGQSLDLAERARMQAQIDRDWRRRRAAAARTGLAAEHEWSWTDICPRLMPTEYSNFQPWIYSLDVVLPVLDLRQQKDWAPRLYADDGTVLRPLFSLPEGLPLAGGTWGLGHLVRLWEWFAIFAGWTLAFLFAASVSGIIKKD